MKGTLINFVSAFLAIGLVYYVSKCKKLSLKEDIGLVFPSLKDILLWGIAFLFLMILDDYLYKLNVSEAIEAWVGKYSTTEIVVRAFGIVVLAPIAEELLFRGLLYARIKKTKLKINLLVDN